MEAHFKVNRPLSNLNYGILKDDIFSKDPRDLKVEELRNFELLKTGLSISISLDPVLELPAENEYDYYSGHE